MKKLALLFSTLLATTVSAHDGHGKFDGNSLIHHLTSPFHAILILMVLCGLVFFLYRRSEKVNR